MKLISVRVLAKQKNVIMGPKMFRTLTTNSILQYKCGKDAYRTSILRYFNLEAHFRALILRTKRTHFSFVSMTFPFDVCQLYLSL